MANFEVCIRFRSPHTSRTDFPHQQLVLPSPSPIPHVVDAPPEFLEANIGYVASWSEVEGQSNSCPRRKEDPKAKKSSSSFCAIVAPRQRRDPPLIDVPDLSGVLPLFSLSPPLPVFFTPLPPVFSAPPLSPLCGLGARDVPSLPAVEAKFPPQHVFSPTQPCKTRHQSQKG